MEFEENVGESLWPTHNSASVIALLLAVLLAHAWQCTGGVCIVVMQEVSDNRAHRIHWPHVSSTKMNLSPPVYMMSIFRH